jgi:hypothetical protein
MAEALVYVVLGRGRWAQRMRSMLGAEHRRVTAMEETRQHSGESDAVYRQRLAVGMQKSGAEIAWACVLPGPHLTLMVEAALDANLHMICEKPWSSSRQVTESLSARAKSLGRLVGVHYEYCFLSELQRWRSDFGAETALQFGGRFFLDRPTHTGMSPLDNLGTHLMAIRNYAVPHATIKELQCGYEQPNERIVWLEREGQRIASLNLLEQKEPIIQRFIAEFESSRDMGRFPIDLEFGLRVAEDIATLR